MFHLEKGFASECPMLASPESAARPLTVTLPHFIQEPPWPDLHFPLHIHTR